MQLEGTGTKYADFSWNNGSAESKDSINDNQTFNTDPTADKDSAETPSDTPVTINVLKNDNDAEGDDLTVTVTNQGSGGTAVVNDNNTITYTLNTDPLGVAPNFTGTDSFEYTISDGNGGTDATATVEVTVPDSDPVAEDDEVSTPSNPAAALNIDVIDNDKEVDNQPLEVVAFDDSSTTGTVVDNGDGTFDYTPETDFTGEDSFTYTISDGSNLDEATVTINVENGETIANPDTATTDSNTDVDIRVLDNDTDAENQDLSISVDGSTAQGGTVTNITNADGTEGLRYTPATNFTGSDSFDYTVSDGNGGEDTANVTITVCW